MRFRPEEFPGQKALFFGTAQNDMGTAVMRGNGWAVTVDANGPWPEGMEGKEVETLGMYKPQSDAGRFQLIDGTWRLSKLEDQLGQEVLLRGRARETAGAWWFEYRGTQLYVENIADLPGWSHTLSWTYMEIRGVLDKALLPRIDQIGEKSVPDVQEQFIVRKPSWKPLNSPLLAPEVHSSSSPEVEVRKGMALAEALTLLRNRNIVVEKAAVAAIAVNVLEYEHHSVGTPNGSHSLILSSTRKEGEDELRLRGLKVVNSGPKAYRKSVYFESLSLDAIEAFSNEGVYPPGGTEK